MKRLLVPLEMKTGREWRRWLKQHHASSGGVWLVFYKAGAGVSLDYEEAVREALCFGWIDSLIKRLDDHRYARKFTPRRATSKWSELNRARWAELEKAGLLAPAGLAAAPTAGVHPSRELIPELPEYIAAAFRANRKAWQFFQELAPTYRRHYVGWIHSAKRPETRQKRIREAIALLASGRKLGLK